MTDLKPCPFCDGDAIAVGTYIMCEYCGTQTVEYPSRDEAVDLWNTRAHDPASFEAGEKAMREGAATKALEVGEIFRVRNQSSYAEGYDDGTSCAASAIRALPTG